eukprot:TRINITY_DN6137_c0_g1_i1.p1 TRINITY_DN6137_c0_g1~~TRINITY_DN6137_c0_g1_i1.p1  ORF type:complete len:207 (+),score=36.29 TRINITY_DN6137_c0_g1_i1:24-623(+)
MDPSTIDPNPISLFTTWLTDTLNNNTIKEPYAMTLSTCTNNRPSSRTVLLKQVDENGFVWYTNYNSRKGRELDENPFAALNFWWEPRWRAVRVEGRVVKVSEDVSDAYFASRERGSQLGAWASDQSAVIESRDVLVDRLEMMTERFDGEEIQRPEHWGGYCLVPDRIEFFEGREHRLHDRIVYSRENVDDEWVISRLSP